MLLWWTWGGVWPVPGWALILRPHVGLQEKGFEKTAFRTQSCPTATLGQPAGGADGRSLLRSTFNLPPETSFHFGLTQEGDCHHRARPGGDEPGQVGTRVMTRDM